MFQKSMALCANFLDQCTTYVHLEENILNINLAGLLKSGLVPKNHKKFKEQCRKNFRLSKVASAEIQTF